MRGSIEMNIIKQFASRVMVFGLAIAILGTGLVMSGDNNAVEAETLSSLYFVLFYLITQNHSLKMINQSMIKYGARHFYIRRMKTVF